MSIWSKLFRSSEPPGAPPQHKGQQPGSAADASSAAGATAEDDTKATLHDSPSKLRSQQVEPNGSLAEGPPTRPQPTLEQARAQTQANPGAGSPAPMPSPAVGATKLKGRRTLRGDIGDRVADAQAPNPTAPVAKASPSKATRPSPGNPKKTLVMGAMGSTERSKPGPLLKRSPPRKGKPTTKDAAPRQAQDELSEPTLENPLPMDSGPDFEMQFQPAADDLKNGTSKAAPPPGVQAPTRPTKLQANLREKPKAPRSESRAPGQLANSVLDALVDAEDPLDGEVDALFDAATSQGGGDPALANPARPDDLDEMFEQMVAMHLRPVRDLMLEVRWGAAPSSWISHCRVALRTVQDAAAELDRPDLKAQLDKLASTLDAAAKDGRAEVSNVFKGPLLSAYEPIAKLAPEELSLEDEFGRREPVLVRSVLLQAQDVEHVTLGKLFGAGLSTMQGLLAANADDVSMTANVPSHLSNRIVRRVDEYKGSFGTTTASIDRKAELKRLETVLRELEKTQERYETASRGWSDEAVREKRDLHKERGRLLLRVSVVMARMGETDLLNELERMPFEMRIQKLAEYLGKQAPASR